jgi:hypothetical protein
VLAFVVQAQRHPARACQGVIVTPFQGSVSEAFLAVMRARRPELLWSIREAGKGGEEVASPDEVDTISDRPPRAA